MLTSLLLTAWAANVTSEPRSDLAVHTVGVRARWSNAVGKGDADFLIGEKLRWSISDATRVHVDGRFIIDPDGEPVFERYRVRRLGLSFTKGDLTVLVGRHVVPFGGPRLADGIQVLYSPAPLTVGVWAGLAPDLFTTAPRLRPGFGPMVGFVQSTVQASVAGDLLFADGGLDRASVVGNARWTPSRRIALDGRADVELASAQGGPHLSDGRVAASLRPTDAVRLGAFYNAFSSFKYLRTEELSPELRRFDARILEQGLGGMLAQDQRDPILNHMVGTDFTVRPTGDTTAPVFEFRARYRHNPDVKNRFTQVALRAGLTRIGGNLEVDALATLRNVDTVNQADLGLQGVLELGDGCCMLDMSVLALINPERYSGPGAYADLFLDAILDSGLAIGVGANALIEPVDAVDFGMAGFARLSYYQRHRRD